jgi:hypothetical protein
MSVNNVKKLSELITSISYISANETHIYTEPKDTMPIPFYPDNKFTIDVSHYIPDDFELENIEFVVKNIPGYYLKINIVDKESVVNRPLSSNKMRFSGDKIELQMKNQEKQALYLIDLRYLLTYTFVFWFLSFFSQTVNKDLRTCDNYPIHESYATCDDTFLRRSLTRLVESEYVPIWIAKTGKVIEAKKTEFVPKTLTVELAKLFLGLKENDCKAPCRTTMVKSLKDSESDFTSHFTRGMSMVVLALGNRYYNVNAMHSMFSFHYTEYINFLATFQIQFQICNTKHLICNSKDKQTCINIK